MYEFSVYLFYIYDIIDIYAINTRDSKGEGQKLQKLWLGVSFNLNGLVGGGTLGGWGWGWGMIPPGGKNLVSATQ